MKQTNTSDRVVQLRDRALSLADEAALTVDYHNRRQIEQEALAFWRLARRLAVSMEMP